MAKATLLPGKTGYGCPPPVRPRRTSADHPDLYLLRDAAADGGARSPTTWLARPKLAWMRFSWMLPKMRWSTMRKRCGLTAGDPVRPKCSQKKLSTCW